jgi:hypothetical protein
MRKTILAGLLPIIGMVWAAAPQDRIDVLANVPVTASPIVRVTTTQHYSRSYLYLEHASGELTLVDVTNPKQPSIVSNLGQSGSILTAAGDAALVSSEAAQTPVQASKTISIVSFADPAHPRTVKQFAHVTSTASDERRGLVFVANDEGLWILHRNPAEDPQVQADYAHEVWYNH